MKIPRAELTSALRRSLKVQSGYAKLLNAAIGGDRPSFAGIDEWLAYLRTRDAQVIAAQTRVADAEIAEAVDQARQGST